MINPLNLMKLLNERHEFIKNHPDLYPFLKETFGSDISKGSTIELKVTTTEGIEKEIKMTIQESEQPLFNTLKEFINQIDK